MSLVFQNDLTSAAWVEEADDGLTSVYGPTGFKAYARLFHTESGASHQDLIDAEGTPTAEQHRMLVATLADLGRPTDPCTCCLWDGFGTIHSAGTVVGSNSWVGAHNSHPAFGDEVLRGPRLHIDVLEYLVFCGALRDAGDWGARPLPPQAAPFGSERPISVPNLMWPMSRAWFVTSHIDLPWTGVAGPSKLVQRVCARWPGDAEVLAGRPSTVLYGCA